MKKYIIGVITGLLISGIVAYALTASEITYKDNKTVNDALNELYYNIENKAVENDFKLIKNVTSPYVTNKASNTLTMSDVAKGKYILELFRTDVEGGNKAQVLTPNDITYNISLCGSKEYLGGNFYLLDITSNCDIIINTTTTFTSTTVGGYVFAYLFLY